MFEGILFFIGLKIVITSSTYNHLIKFDEQIENQIIFWCEKIEKPEQVQGA